MERLLDICGGVACRVVGFFLTDAAREVCAYRPPDSWINIAALAAASFIFVFAGARLLLN